MLEWTIEDNSNKYFITINNKETNLKITKVSLNGGRPMNVTIKLNKDDSFVDVVARVNKLCKLDNELFNLMSEHTS